MEKTREYWLDGFEGACKSGAMYRSRIHLDLDEFESKFDKKVVGIKLETDYETEKPSWTVEFYVEVTEADAMEMAK